MNQKQKKYFKQYDEQLRELPLLFQKRRDEIIELTGWKKGDGLCPLHFQDRPAGSQCTWSAVWHGASGDLRPGDYFPLDTMTAQELLLEAMDLCNQNIKYSVMKPDPVVIRREILPFVEKHFAGDVFSPELLKRKLQKLRESYSTYVAPWDLTGGFLGVMFRPGWGTAEAVQEAKQSRPISGRDRPRE